MKIIFWKQTKVRPRPRLYKYALVFEDWHGCGAEQTVQHCSHVVAGRLSLQQSRRIKTGTGGCRPVSAWLQNRSNSRHWTDSQNGNAGYHQCSGGGGGVWTGGRLCWRGGDGAGRAPTSGPPARPPGERERHSPGDPRLDPPADRGAAAAGQAGPGGGGSAGRQHLNVTQYPVASSYNEWQLVDDWRVMMITRLQRRQPSHSYTLRSSYELRMWSGRFDFPSWL